MIEMITGAPGAGKTLFAVETMVKAHDSGRKLFVHGVPGLLVPHELVSCGQQGCRFCEGKQGHDLATVEEWAEPNSLLVLDEVQHQFRNRPAGSAVPKPVQFMETHRHRGIDILLITQSPSLVDQNIRKLVTQHHHIKNRLGGRDRYTWAECNDNPKSGTSGAIKTPWKLKKRYFGLYKSAEVHTKASFPIPRAVYYLAFVLVGLGVLGWRILGKVSEDIEAVSAPAAAATGETFLGNPNLVGAQLSSSTGSAFPGQRTVFQQFDFEPRVAGVLESAPAYEGMPEFEDFPRRVGCMATRTRCECFTQQGTVYPTTVAQCRAYLEPSSRPFDPYRAPSRGAPVASAASPAIPVPPPPNALSAPSHAAQL